MLHLDINVFMQAMSTVILELFGTNERIHHTEFVWNTRRVSNHISPLGYLPDIWRMQFYSKMYKKSSDNNYFNIIKST